MKLTKKKKEEILKIYDTWMHSYLNGDVQTYDSYFADEYHFIGSTDNEEFLNRKDTTQFFKDTAAQFSGKTDLRKQTTTIEAFDDLIFITHLFDAWFINGTDWTYYGRFRFTSVLQEKKEGWKFIYQHFSIADSKTDEGESIGFDKVNEENQELREAIKRRTVELEAKNRELEIEGALGRIRAQATAMAESSELLDIVVTMRNEFTRLGHEAGYFWHMMWLPETYEKAMTSGDGSKIGFVMKLPRHMHGDIPLLAKWEKSKKSTIVYAMTTKEAIDYVDKMVMLGDFQNIDPQAPSHDDLKHIGGLTFIMARTTHGEIGYSLPGVVKNPPAEDLDILTQFAGAFDLAHRRFLDLQKAEKQAREVQIELALEKVRSRTMAMQHSDELAETSFLLDEQVRALGIKTWGCAFNIYGEHDSTEWFGNEAGVLPTYTVPRTGIFKKYYQKGQKGDSLHIEEFSGDECVSHYEYMSSLPVIGKVLKKLKETNKGFPTYQIDHVVYFKYGYLLFITREHVPEAHDVFKRFAKVFEQTYTRFLDLQKAEAQAKEAQIEAALERVRSRSMAMHKSEEMLAVIGVVSEQLQQLNLNFDTVSFAKNNQEGDFTFWITSRGQHKPLLMEVPTFDSPVLKGIYKAQKKGITFLADVFSAEVNKEWHEHLIKFSDLKHFPDKIKDFILKAPGFARSSFLLKNIDLYVGNYRAVPFTDEENSIFGRFAQVFEQAYTRFLDLQKAEAQAREAQIEAALERVRAQSMAMHTSDELKDVIRVIFDQMGQISINAEHAGIVVDYEPKKDWHFWVAETQDIPAKISVPYTDNVWDRQFTEAKKNGKALFTTLLNFEEKNAFYKELLPHIEGLTQEMQDHYYNRAGLAISTAIQKNIGLYIENFAGTPYTQEENGILLRFAKVFEQTYTRFLDLQKAEAQAKEAQIETALERVRSQSMGMQTSKDLSNVTTEMFNQLRQFGGDLYATGIVFCDKHKGHVEQWHSLPDAGMISPFIVPIDLDYIHQYRYNQWKKETALFSIEIPSDFIEQHFNDIYKLPSAQVVLKEFEANKTPMPSTPDWEIDYGASFKHGYLLVSSLQPFKEAQILPRFAKVFEQTYTRFLDLQKAEAQAREAQIEHALEKVRSRTMAMQNSSEMPEAANNLFLQVQELGIPAWSAGYCIWEDNQKSATAFMSSEGVIQKPFVLPAIGVGYDFSKPLQKGEVFHVEELGGNLIKKHYEFMRTLPIFGEVIDGILEAGHPLPTFQIFHICYFKYGYVMFITYETVPKAHDIFKRFSKVFEQTYTRFLDLQKAEAQTREAQIEAALERTRTQSILMQRSDELSTTTQVFHEQLQLLGIDSEFSYLWLPDEDEKNHLFWATWDERNKRKTIYKNKAVTFPLDKSEPSIEACYVAWESGETVHVNAVAPNEVKDYFNIWSELLDGVDKFQPELFPDGLFYIDAYMDYGCFGIMIKRRLDEDEKNILNRFSKEFQRTYTRFLDLQKAEAQAREAQIETALEKVRSRTMAMQKGEEVKDVVVLLYKELIALGVTNFASCGYVEINEETNRQETWVTNPGGDSLGLFYLPLTGDVHFDARYKAWKNKQTVFHQTVAGKERRKHLEYAITTFNSKEAEEMVRNQFPDPTVFYCFNFSHGYLHLVCGSYLNKEEESLLARFTRVFEQTYARFLDLKKAEAQAREAQIENALEKVRSRSLAMHKPDELQEVITVVAEKLQELGVIFDVGGVILCTYFPDNKDVVHWIASPDLSSSQSYLVPYFDNPIFNESWDSKNRGDAYFSKEFPVEAKNHFFEYAFEHSDYRHFPGDYKQHVLKADKHNLSAAWSKNSAILIPSLTGVVPSDSDADIIKRFAKVFEQAYIRFMDLQKAEAQARESQIEAALEKVRSRSLEMHQSTEMQKVANEIREQVRFLGVEIDALAMSGVIDNDSDYDVWVGGANSKKPLRIPYNNDTQVQRDFNKAIKERPEIFSKTYKGKVMKAYFKYLMETGNSFNPEIEQFMLKCTGFTNTLTFMKNSGIQIIRYSEESFSDADNAIVIRFGKVFEQAYIRFLDLQKAEEQTLLAEQNLIKLKTQKQRAEEALSELQQTQTQLIQSEKMASLGELTAGIAHEIQNPLNFVNNFSEVSKELLEEMQEEIENGDFEEVKAIMDDVIQNLEKINHHGKRADGIVKGMLQHSRTSSGEKEPTDINELADEYLRLAYHGLRAKDKSFNATMQTDFDKSIGTINIIPQDIGRVILNLFTNAFYVVNEKKKSGIKNYDPTVSISTKKNKNSIEIIVSDNGNGISKKVIEKIFQPFFTTKPTGQGTGLGLSLSYDIVKAHGGELKVETKEGKGTEFKMKLPI